MSEITKSQYTDAMIDVETLGVEGNFVVTQISIVPFTMGDTHNIEKNRSITVNISVKDSLNGGFEINPDTLKWWINADVEMLAEQLKKGISRELACTAITEFLDKYKGIKRFWATATLDYAGISNLFHSVKMKNPIPYNKRMCARTIRMLAENKGAKYENINNHDAFDDCVNQIGLLKSQFAILEYDILKAI